MEALDDGVALGRAAPGRYTVNAVASAVVIFAKVVEDGFTSLDGAAEAAGVSRSTAYRLLATLTALRLLERIPGGGYMPGVEAFRWATGLLEHVNLSKIAKPILRQLREDQGETVNLALIQGSELIYVDVFESPGVLRTVEDIGSRVPLHAAAVGKAVAAFLEQPLLSRMLGPEPYPRLTPNTLTSWSELEPELAGIHDAGYSLDLESVNHGVGCIAAPVFRSGGIVGAISLSGPRTRLSDERLAELAPIVCAAAAEVSHLLSPLPLVNPRRSK